MTEKATAKRQVKRILRLRLRYFRQQQKNENRERLAYLEKQPFFMQFRNKKWRSRLIRVFVVTIIILLFMWLRCSPLESPRLSEHPTTLPLLLEPKVVPTVTTQTKRPKKPIATVIDSTQRPSYRPDSAPSHSWLDDFVLQVSARSPRLSYCFKGSRAPGALRWSALVNQTNGQVSDHAFLAMGGMVEPTAQQRLCLTQVLSTPIYDLLNKNTKMPQDTQSTPVRISLVLEF